MALPGLSAAGAGLVVAVALVETARLLAGGGEAAGLAVLVDGVDDPVDAGVDADGLVLGVDEDHLVVLVGRVLVDPVRVEHAQVGAAAAHALLSRSLERALVFELVDSLVGGLACSSATSAVSDWFLLEICSPERRPDVQQGEETTYQRWHPWRRASCGHHGGRGRGR